MAPERAHGSRPPAARRDGRLAVLLDRGAVGVEVDEAPLDEPVVVDLAVDGARLHELVVRAARHDPALVQDDDLVGERDRREPVRDDHRRPALHHLAQRQLDPGLGGGVDRGGRVVEDENAWVHEQRTGDRDALPLAAREREAALADDGLVTVRQVADELVGLRLGEPP